MTGFAYSDGVWRCESVPMPEIADAVGAPCYVYSKAAVLDTFRAMDQAFGDMPHLICYAVKANGNLAVLAALAGAGCGAEVVSGGELFRALKAGFPPDRIVMDGNGKTPAELRQALEAGIRAINVDSENELRAVERLAEEMGVSAAVGLRVNPDVDPQTHPKISTGLKKSKFGLDPAKAIECCEYARDSGRLRIAGIHMHIGSQILSAAPFAEAIRKLYDFAAVLQDRGIALDFIDLGGGLGIRYNDEEPLSFEDYVATVRPHHEGYPALVVVEPGRRLVGNAGNLLTRVLYVKETPVKRFVVVDAAMNDLGRPSMYDAYHEILSVVQTTDTFTADVVGGICESGDYFARDREIPVVREGDLIVIQSAGAYGAAMSSEYNARPLVPEVLVDGASFRVVRRRPTYEEMIALETGCD